MCASVESTGRITTYNKKYYSGMSLEEAKRKGIDKRTFGTDFYNIDVDNDGILSDREILSNREQSLKNLRWMGAAALMFGILSALQAKFCKKGGSFVRILNICDAIGLSTAGLYTLVTYKPREKENKELEAKLDKTI